MSYILSLFAIQLKEAQFSLGVGSMGVMATQQHTQPVSANV